MSDVNTIDRNKSQMEQWFIWSDNIVYVRSVSYDDMNGVDIETVVLYNVLLLINCYTGNITTKCHSKSTSDNRDLTGTFHQKVSSLPVSIASDSRSFQSS